MSQQQKLKGVIVGKSKKERRNVRRILLLVVLVVVVVLSCGFALKRYAYVESCTNNPRDPLYKEAAAVMDAQKTNELLKVVEKIQKVQAHESDANCLYPIAKYYVNTQNSKKAEEYYAKIEKVYKQGSEFNPIYHQYGDKNISNLRIRLDLLKNSGGNGESSTVFL